MRIGKYTFTRTVNVDPGQRLSIARKDCLLNSDFLVDIGANSGVWIKEIRRMGFTGPALCIEPISSNFESLQNLNLPNTELLNCAIGNKNGVISINEASNSGLSSSILSLGALHKQAEPSIKIISNSKVRIEKLSRILKKYSYRNIYIKIDTQGYELEVIKSIDSDSWSKIYALEIEVNLVETYDNCGKIEDIIYLLRKKGFAPFRLENGFGLPNFGQQLQIDILFKRID
jgi:FkbM family methyltransferase